MNSLSLPATFVPLLSGTTPMASSKPRARKEANYDNGGWPRDEVDFPGFTGNCDIAELSGKLVAANPEFLIREFILKRRPVIVRDYIRHDHVGFLLRVPLMSC